MDFLTIADATLWQRIVSVFTTPSLQLFLLLGSFLLAISLMLLTMTRLGHARPITKCVVLSVIAHILLLGYAYGTRLIFQAPVAAKEQPVQVTIDTSMSSESDLPEPEAGTSIDDFSTSEIEFEPETPDQPAMQRPQPFERTLDFDLDPQADDESGSDPLPLSALNLQQPLLNTSQQPELEFDGSELNENSAPEPETIDFQRRGDREDDVSEHSPKLESLQTTMNASNESVRDDSTPEVLQNHSQSEPAERANQYSSDLHASNTTPESSITDSLMVDRAPQTSGGTIDSMPQNSFDAELASLPRRLADGQIMPKPYRLRSAANREQVAVSRGGSVESEDAVEKALAWLAAHQKDDGRWCPLETDAGREEKVFGHDRGGCGSHAETGITSLAILAFLGAGHTHLDGPYQETVQKALEFVVTQQASNGDLSGNAKLFARMYCHSMSLLAISEALAISGDRRLEKPVRMGVHYSVAAQNRTDGGWRYQPGDSGDMSQFGWQVMALYAAQQSGIEIKDDTLAGMKKFLASCQTGNHGGLASYRPNQGPSTAMTAEAMVCRKFLAIATSPDERDEARGRILSELPNMQQVNLYYWYYGTLAMQQIGGPAWDAWNASLQRVLLSQQSISGRDSGSWKPNGLWAGYGGRVYSTALATLCLEVYYRYQNDDAVRYQAQDFRENGKLDRRP